jgi:hypothetical protein
MREGSDRRGAVKMEKTKTILGYLPGYPPANSKWNAKDQLHCLDGPAVVYPDGSYAWFRDGLVHRDGDEPEIALGDGSLRAWVVDGQLHRDDGPALVTSKKKVWYCHGKRHRDGDLPAVIWLDSSKVKYYCHGKLHRWRDYPAVLVMGVCARFNHRGHLHRDDGPAVICWEHGAAWYQSGRSRDKGSMASLQPQIQALLATPVRTLFEMQQIVYAFQGDSFYKQRIDSSRYGLPAPGDAPALPGAIPPTAVAPSPPPEGGPRKRRCTCRVPHP